jgi:hypothetical protein
MVTFVCFCSVILHEVKKVSARQHRVSGWRRRGAFTVGRTFFKSLQKSQGEGMVCRIMKQKIAIHVPLLVHKV